MQPQFQSSFIPKGPISTSGASPFAPQKKRSAFGFASKWIFALSVIAALGSFGYYEYLLYHIAALGAELDAAKTSLMPDTVTQISHADARLSATRMLLAQHVALSQFFAYLETATEKTVGFTQFTFQTTDKGPTIMLSGQGSSYAALKLQSDTFLKASFLKDQSFSDLALDPKGNVNFSFTASVDPTFFLYKNEFNATSTANAIQPVAVSTTTLPALTVATSTQKVATLTAATSSQPALKIASSTTAH